MPPSAPPLSRPSLRPPLQRTPLRKPLARRDHTGMLRRMPPPTLDDIVRRAQCVLGVLVRAQIEEQLEANPARASDWTKTLERLENWLVHERLDPLLTREESILMRAKWGEWSHDDMQAAVWRIEGLAVLLWNASRLPRLPPFSAAAPSDEVLGAMPFLRAAGDVLAGARQRPSDELDRLRRAAGVWRWRAKTELLHRAGVSPATGEPFEGLVARAAINAAKAGLIVVAQGDFDVDGRPYAGVDDATLRTLAAVALERGRAAEWLCGRGPWDAPAEL